MSELPTQVNFRLKGKKFCINHPKEELQLVCRNCNETLVCLYCVSSEHSGHTFIAIRLLVQEKFNYLQNLETETKDTKIPKLLKRVEDAETTVKELQQGIQHSIKKAEDHGKYLKELIDETTAETVSELKEIEKKILKQFEAFKFDNANAIKQMEAVMKESKEAQQADNNVLIFDVTKEFSSLTIQEPVYTCTVTILKFIKGLDPNIHVKAAFGELEHDCRSDLAIVIQAAAEEKKEESEEYDEDMGFSLFD